MMNLWKLLPIVLLALSCTAPAGSRDSQGPAQQRGEAAPAKRTKMVVGFPGTVTTVSQAGLTGALPEGSVLEPFFNVGLVEVDGSGGLQPMLAESAPTLENGLWKLNPDGSMETTWKLKANTTWQDGTPFTADDLVFTTSIEQDKTVGRLGNTEAYNYIAGIESPDSRTLVITWSQPYIDADKMFAGTTFTSLRPIAKHLVDDTYQSDKTSVINLPYWSDGFVGTGPFRLTRFERGSFITAEANPNFILGRPKIDDVEIRFVPDTNSLLASTLAGNVDLSVTVDLSIDQGVQLQESWREGRIEFGPGYMLKIYGQYIDAHPPIVTNAEFRKALLHSLDRQQMVETLQHGVTSVADTMIYPNQPQYAEILSRVPKFPYDPARAAAIFQELGYVRGPDGFLRDGVSGERLSVELRTIDRDINVKTHTAVADAWQRAGVGVDSVIIPVQRQNDVPYRATFPGFEVLSFRGDLADIKHQRSTAARLAERNYIGGLNYSRYQSAELDSLIDRYYTAVRMNERLDVLGRILTHIADKQSVMYLFYSATPYAISNRLTGPRAPVAPGAAIMWNVHEWQVK